MQLAEPLNRRRAHVRRVVPQRMVMQCTNVAQGATQLPHRLQSHSHVLVSQRNADQPAAVAQLAEGMSR